MSKQGKNHLVLLIGPSGTGKDAIKKASGLPYVVSHRTRSKRDGEVEGVDGIFVSKDEFLSKDQEYWIAKTEYNGHYYGTSVHQFKPLEYSHMIYVIDWNGYEYLKSKYKESPITSIFIESRLEDIKKRMIHQGRNQIEIDERLARVHKDLEAKEKCDFIISNKVSLKDSVRQLFKIINSLQ